MHQDPVKLIHKFVLILAMCLLLPAVHAQALKPADSNKLPAPAKAKDDHSFVIAVHEWPPYTGKNLPNFGLVPRILTQVLSEQGLQPRYVFMHWSDALDKLNAQEVDGAIVWVTDDLKADVFVLGNAIILQRTALYYRADQPAPKTPDDIMGFTFCVNPHYVYDNISYQLITQHKVEAIKGDTDADNLRHLVKGDCDFMLTPYNAGQVLFAAKLTLAEQKKIKTTMDMLKLPAPRLLMHRENTNSEKLLENVNRSLRRMQQAGSFDNHMRDYQGKTY